MGCTIKAVIYLGKRLGTQERIALQKIERETESFTPQEQLELIERRQYDT